SGVSFVANYRGQFDKVIRTSSYQILMRDLRTKYAEVTGRTARPATVPAAAATVPAVTPAATPADKTP
ncbi:MAG: hypothetical protein ACREJY_11370, partial [Candidatus Rokuibacteriota bacterium]